MLRPKSLWKNSQTNTDRYTIADGFGTLQMAEYGFVGFARGSEAYIVGLLEHTNLLAIHAKKIAVMKKTCNWQEELEGFQ